MAGKGKYHKTQDTGRSKREKGKRHTGTVYLRHCNTEEVYILNTELNDLRKIICLRNSEVSVSDSVCYVTESLGEHGIHCLPCSYTNGVIKCYRNNDDIILMSK